MDDANNALISIKDALKDEKRIKYHNDHLMNLLAAIKCVNQSVYIYVM
jgi:beta-glucosidase